MHDKHRNILKIGDTVSNNQGKKGKLTNRGGKTWIDFKDGSVPFNEVDLNYIEKVQQ